MIRSTALALALLLPAVAWADDFKPQPAGSISTADANAASLAAARAAARAASAASSQSSAVVSPTININNQAAPTPATTQTLDQQQAETVTRILRAPDVNPPALVSGGFDCPTVGLSPGGSGLSGGGAVGISWISSDCNTRKLADLLRVLGYPQAAVILLQRHFSEVATALQVSGGK